MTVIDATPFAPWNDPGGATRVRAFSDDKLAVGVHRDLLASLGLGYQDVVGATEVVVTKPGFGIASNAIGAARVNGTRRFPGVPVLVREMEPT